MRTQNESCDRMKAARSPKSPELQPELLEDQPSAPGDDQPLDDD
jgi:hypothetical protein